MSRIRQLVKALTKSFKKLSKQSLSAINKQLNWLLRTVFNINRRRSSANSGFVLPTVAMVSLVVVLLTTAILIRSFDRSKNASNVRVNEAVLNAAMPAIDRAKAKIEQLLADPSLPRSTPTDISLYNAITRNNGSRYTFGDEISLILASDLNTNNSIQTSTTLEDDETLNTAWKFPVDTDNNGKFDSFTLYAIYFRSPTRNTSNIFNRARKPLDARTPPMDKGQVGGICADAIGTSASLIGDSSWYKSGGKLAKSFFVYTANVPINALGALDTNKYEAKANRGFSALEYQQDRERIPVNNKAVWFENDLEITPGGNLLLNGSVHTNGNLLAAPASSTIDFRQVSSENSCFYDQENAKITVGGNLAPGGASDTTNRAGLLRIDLFRPNDRPPTQDVVAVSDVGGATKKSTTATGGSTVGSNDAAYTRRINTMKDEAVALCTTCNAQTTVDALRTEATNVTRYPQVLKDNLRDRLITGTPIETAQKIFRDEIENFLRDRTRRVPFAEVSQSIPTDAQALGTYATGNVFAAGEIEVPAAWRLITPANTGLTLNFAQLAATEPEKQKTDGKENYEGDRVLIGNNLPAVWKNDAGEYGTGQKFRQIVNNGTNWNSSTTPNEPRTRASQLQPQLNLGETDRGEFWEEKAAEDNSANPLSNVGGLRVVTGAGIYVDDDGVPRAGETPFYQRSTFSFLPNPNGAFSRNTNPAAGIAGLDLIGTNGLDGSNNPVGFISNITGVPGQAVTGQMPDPPTFDATRSNIVVWPDTMPMTSPLYIPSPVSGEIKKGDLLMRATAVYHFSDNAGIAQTPIACVSSYYDPTNNITAQNLTGLWQNPNPAFATTTGGRSNNGVVYSPVARTNITANLDLLRRQSRLVFPNGRIANEPLRKAIKKYDSNSFTNFTMADYSAVDTALCALSILDGTATIDPSRVPHGAIKEASFLDAREIKANQDIALHNTINPAIPGDYNLDLEQRQPLEIRVTEINLGVLANTAIGGSEYLLPKSGIIYATRDDALPDISDATVNPADYRNGNIEKILLLSQTDFKLDPTRRPNGIRLFNGTNLSRTGINRPYDPSEKGLILATNLPAYVKGNFNLHQVTAGGTQIEEFSTTETTANFYTRAGFNNDFACRPGRGACPASGGDLWRPSTILADAITLLSDSFLDGFRDQGDFDFRDNATTIPENNSTVSPNPVAARLVNNFVTTASNSWTGTFNSPNIKTSYNANGVTPIQRRTTFNEYLMEVCDQPSPSMCDQGNPAHWKVFFRRSAGGTPQFLTATQVLTDNTLNTGDFVLNNLLSGTTATPPDPAYPQYRNYPRRVAFERVISGITYDPGTSTIQGALLFRNGGGNEVPGIPNNADSPVPLGIDSNGNVIRSPYRGSNNPRTRANALWFKTTSYPQDPSRLSDGTYNVNQGLFLQSLPRKNDTIQPSLVPVLQIYSPEGSPLANGTTLDLRDNNRANSQIQNQWVQRAPAGITTFNTGLAAGNSPSRPEEQAAGLQAFVRYLENWPSGTGNEAKIRGNFIQFKRSSFATAPLATLLTTRAAPTGNNTTDNFSFFDFIYKMYWTNVGVVNSSNTILGTLPYYSPPGRNWGFDVGLLSQLPDLFAQRFTVPPSAPPAEYFRQVGRDDKWVETLLCATENSDFSLPASYRPSDCLLAPS
ncbi:hypothetical protein Cylst_5658 [Cylindrospermum stagnale PCC 7417]|uniref:Uncharacterized protein n=1 Tax=Cylindrospermum stagnale PCC 7417 TaxID=56107 RepID=K9X5B9_9NOST|nr:hormogonium polysaccharide biosynthesis protein HpsA [Cylindrospermum stagnale]AFZ27658.1 hypothetical protein Cylst_5658 [Cylindrospermum stagnale PCC 7417]